MSDGMSGNWIFLISICFTTFLSSLSRCPALALLDFSFFQCDSFLLSSTTHTCLLFQGEFLARFPKSKLTLPYSSVFQTNYYAKIFWFLYSCACCWDIISLFHERLFRQSYSFFQTSIVFEDHTSDITKLVVSLTIINKHII